MKSRSGFTLIELLVVIAIIGILSSVVLVSLDTARERAKITTTNEQLRNIKTGIFLLVNDTGKGPNGCLYGRTANPEVRLDAPQAGLVERPTPGVHNSCEWTTADVAKWRGPYIESPRDPWGYPYIFDPDYIPYRNCSTKPNQGVIQAIVAPGPDGSAGYTCDDIWLHLKR